MNEEQIKNALNILAKLWMEQNGIEDATVVITKEEEK